MAKLNHCKFSLLTLVLGGGLYVASLVWRLNPFEGILNSLARWEAYQADELALALFIFCAGVLTDLVALKIRRLRQQEVERQRLLVLKATMNTVQDIVNNFLNSLQYFRFLAQKGGALEPDILSKLDDLIFDTSAKLRALAELESTPERKVGQDVVLIDFPQPTPTRKGA